jgi:hypothetical protein
MLPEFSALCLSYTHRTHTWLCTGHSESIQTPWLFPHFVTALFWNGLNIFFPSSIYTQYPIMTSQYPIMTSQYPIMTSQYPKMTSHPIMTSQYPIMTSQYPKMTKQKLVFRSVCKCIKSIQNLYSVLCWSTFGSDYSLKSSWILGYKLGTPVFGEFLKLFSADPLKLCQVGLGALLHSYFQVPLEMFDRFQVQALAGPLKDIQRLVPKPLL